MSIRITCAICTYRQPKTLPATIDSLIQQNLPKHQYEILIVDNNSNDETASISEVYVQKHANIRYILEEKTGLSNARNRAIDEAEGEIIAFIDDDAIAEAQWLQALLGAYDANPDVWIAGGNVLPLWEAERPLWLKDELLPMLSLRNWSGDDRALLRNEKVIGTNMSIKREVLDTIGIFDPNLGRKGSVLTGYEDTEIQDGVHNHDKLVYFVKEAIVHHRIPPERLRKDYFFRRTYGVGRSRAYFYRQENSYFITLAQIPITIIGLLKVSVRIILTTDEDLKFQLQRGKHIKLGYLQQLFIDMIPRKIVRQNS